MFPVYGRPVASEKFASGIEGAGDVLVRVEALNIAKAEAVAAWDLHSVGKARVGRFNERSVLMCGAELVISQFPKNEKKVVCRRPGGVLCVPCSSESQLEHIKPFFPALTVCCRCILSGISGIPDIV